MKSPLWMPAGSIRDIVFLMVMGTACILALNGRVEAKDFLVIAMAIVGYLVGAKSNQPPTSGGANA